MAQYSCRMFFRMRTPGSLQFTVLALTLMILVKVFVIDGIEQYTGAKTPVYPSSVPSSVSGDKPVIQQGAARAIVQYGNAALPSEERPSVFARDMKELALDLPQPEFIPNTAKPADTVIAAPEKDATQKTVKGDSADPVSVTADQSKPDAQIQPEKDTEKGVEKDQGKSISMPDYKRMAGGAAKVVIIIDDMGLARSNTRAIMDLPAPLTLAFLPYADNLAEFTQPALEKGHELIIHVPMEPMGSGHSLGPAGLTTRLSEAEFKATLNTHIFPSFDGYVGINNHMGSKLTQNRQAMGWVMEELKNRGLYFVDSKTIGSSVAARVAMENGVPFAERDVFLDHYDTLDSVMKALGELERVAHRKGVGIAIGHPKSHTIEALRRWMPDMAKRGLELVPASAVLHDPQAQATAKMEEPVIAAAAPAVSDAIINVEKQGPELPEQGTYYLKAYKSISAGELLGFDSLDTSPDTVVKGHIESPPDNSSSHSGAKKTPERYQR